MPITITKGNILEQPVDYIVNAANGHLRHGGGIARVIAEAATYWPAMADRELMSGYVSDHYWEDRRERTGKWRQDHANAPLIATGDAYVTSAGVLPFKGVVHAVGPIWGGGFFWEDKLLERAHQSVYYRLGDLGDHFASVAFPAISCGIFGFPIKRAAQIALMEANKYNFNETTFVLFSDEDYEAYVNAAKAFQFLNPAFDVTYD